MSTPTHRIQTERFRGAVAAYFEAAGVPVTPRIPRDRRTPRLSDAILQASPIIAGEHFSVTVSRGTPLDVSGRLDAAQANAAEDGKAYEVAILQRSHRTGLDEQFAVLSLGTLVALVQQIEGGME